MSYVNRSTVEWQSAIGENIRDARIAREMDQQTLADRASVNRVTLSRLENGDTTTVATLIKVIRALGREDWFDSLDETGGGLSPLALARQESREPKKRQRVSRKVQAS
ncbi:hypothetical protein GCM10027022_09330 [Alpinimonas psychrophila]|uniref:Transcriptional regulator with XRE-family HTH domain n=1 Tax=Alpinimonas psychrophila TaxID=748908 RepID=A0A7W3JT94_9MICO|nr:helix-turn-helix transcriptional regulator [Alpinimonas psychrophila]MBA8828755.1 transcriptional regulator with XRE-family HTH domain [Alpinimonas psychrophila]